MDEICKMCDSRMVSQGQLNSGNAQFEVFLCVNCGQQSTKAMGLKKAFQSSGWTY